jgi:hypothetical protein
VASARPDEAKTADKSGAAADRRATEDDSAAFETANSLDRAAVFVSCAVELISVAAAVGRLPSSGSPGKRILRVNKPLPNEVARLVYFPFGPRRPIATAASSAPATRTA